MLGYDHTCKSRWCCANVDDLSDHVTCCMFAVSEYTFCILGLMSHLHCGWILTAYTSYDIYLCKDVPFGGHIDSATHLVRQVPQKLPFWLHEWAFSSKVHKILKHCIFKTIPAIPPKFCRMMKTSMYPLRVVPKCVPQIQDGGQLPS